MHDRPTPPPRRLPHVPPGSTPLRELAAAITAALTLPSPAASRDEITYLRLARDRARLVLSACRDILADREIEDDPRDVMVIVCSLREEATRLPSSGYGHAR